MTTFRRHHLFDAVVWTAGLMFLLLFGVHEAHADEHRFDVGDARYRAECGSCHVPFPPALLSAAQWKQVMAGLERHYGVDASVDADTAAALSNWLAARAGRERAADAAPGEAPRITASRWFRKEHREAQPLLASGRVKRAADCAACHAGAEQGDYSERGLRPLAAKAR